MKHVWRWSLLAAVGAIALVEIGARIAGLIDFPLYHADAKIGYIPKASQKGSFLNTNDWEFNADHMGAAAYTPDGAAEQGRDYTLLIGDSIVYGGNPYLQKDKLGPQLQGLVKSQIWPISAGSWSLQNELTWLAANPKIVERMGTIVFVINKGDLSPASSWSCSWTHPLERPASAVWYLAGKYVLKLPCEGTPAALAVPPQDPLVMLKSFLDSKPAATRVMFILYPDQKEAASDAALSDGVDSFKSKLLAQGDVEVKSVGLDAKWVHQPSFYRDGIHPTPEGMGVLAEIIAKQIDLSR